MGIFYNPPQPVQGTPHAPIPAQGQQPPRVPEMPTVTGRVVREAWEPPPPQPTQKVLYVPIPKQGNSPPVGSGMPQCYEEVLKQWWVPPDPQPTQRVNYSSPAKVYGDQPPPYSVVLAVEVRSAWEPPDPQPQRPLPTFPIPAQGFLGGQPPPFVPGMSRVNELVAKQWWEPPPPQPTQKRLLFPTPPISVGCLELQDGTGHLILQAGGCVVLQGTPSPGTAPYTPPPALIAASWPAQWWPAQSSSVSAVPSLPRGDRPPPYSVVVQAGLRQSWEPPPPQPTQKVLYTPIPAQGDRPQPSVVTVPAGVLASWQPVPPLPWVPPGTAAWNVPAVVAAASIPYTQPPATVLAAWALPWWPTQSAPAVAPLTLTYGGQPPLAGGRVPAGVLAAWEPQAPQPQAIPGNAAWNVPAVISTAVPYSPLPPSIVAAWPGEWWPTQRVPTATTARQPRGDQPPPYSVLLPSVVRRTWEPPDPQPRQLLPPSVPVPAQGGRPAPSPVSQPPHVTASWPGVWWPTQSTPLTAPLSLVYGQQPPHYSVALQAELRSLWEPDDPLPPLRTPSGSWMTQSPAVTVTTQPLFGLFFRKSRRRELLRRKDRRRDTDLAMAAWILGED